MTVTSSKRKLSCTTTTTTSTEDNVTENIGIRYSCDYCYKDISSIVRIQCAECGLSKEDNTNTGDVGFTEGIKVSSSYNLGSSLEEVDLCVECFSAGVEFANHKKTHPYRILKPLDFAIFREDWRADEEILLLEAVESSGLGNWQDVAEQLGTRNPIECKTHYMEVYLDPVDASPKTLSKEEIKRSIVTLKRQAPKKLKLATSEEAIAITPTPQSVPANHEIAGFMPLRGEFETEFENDAEMVIKDLQFTDEDGPAERSLKFAMLDIYTMVLERRAARHNFIFSHGLNDFKRHQSVDKSRSKEEREIYNSLKPFARFMACEDFQKLLDGMVREEELRRQIANLQELRRYGIRSFEEVPAFETEKKHLELYLKGGTPLGTSSHSSSSASMVPLQAPATTTTTTTITAKNLTKEPFPLPTMATFLKSTSNGSSQVNAGTTISIPRPSYPETVLNNSLAASPITTLAATPVNNGPTVTPASSGGRKASTPLNISHAEGVELLSEKERHLCSILRLYPRLYLSIKDTLIREYLKLGGLKRAQARAAVKIDVNKTSKLYDFFVAAGWIKPPASGE